MGGPASLLISFSLIGLMLFCTMHALGEMAVLFPVAGSFSAYSTRFLDAGWGFSMGWNYALQWLCVLPLEIVCIVFTSPVLGYCSLDKALLTFAKIAASITINYWDTEQKYKHAIFVTIFLVVIVSINLIGVKGYGEAEFFFAIIKVIAVIGYM